MNAGQVATMNHIALALRHGELAAENAMFTQMAA